MQKVKVFNENVFDFKSNFKGDPVFIKAKSYWKNEDGTDRIMDIFEANDFRCDYHPIKLNGDGKQDPETFKMIRIEKVDQEAAAPVMSEHTCNLCKHKSPSAHELDAHIKFKHAEAALTSIPEEDAKPKKKSA